MAVDVSRESSGVYLPAEVAREVWQGVQEQSVIQQVATQIDLPGNGTAVDIITGDPVVSWPGETDKRTVSRGTSDSKKIQGYTASLLVPFSKEFKRDKMALYNAMVQRFPRVLAKAIDSKCLFGAAPGSNFDSLASVATQDVAAGASNAAYTGLVGAMDTIVGNDGDVSAWVLSPKGEINFLEQLDGNDRPVFSSDGRALVSRPWYKTTAAGASGSPNTLGFAGDWTQAFWGVVDGIRYEESDQVTIEDGTVELTTSDAATVDVPKYINTWQQNMFAVKVEIEFGFRVKTTDVFVRLTD